jgi:hypothetical protein
VAGQFLRRQWNGSLLHRRRCKPEQRRELEAIFTGKEGVLLAPLWGAVVSSWLPTEATRIEIGWGDSPSLSVGNVAQAKLTALKDQAGRPTRVEGAAAQAAFQLASMDLASSKGSRWSDPKLREWLRARRCATPRLSSSGRSDHGASTIWSKRSSRDPERRRCGSLNSCTQVQSEARPAYAPSPKSEPAERCELPSTIAVSRRVHHAFFTAASSCFCRAFTHGALITVAAYIPKDLNRHHTRIEFVALPAHLA